MNRSVLLCALSALLFPALAQAQSAPFIWTVTRPLGISQQDCIRQSNQLLRSQRWSTTWTDYGITNAQNNNYSAQITCRTDEKLVTFVVAGPNRNRTRSFAENLSNSRVSWDTINNNTLIPGTVFGPGVVAVPRDFNEEFYLINNPDVAEAVRQGRFRSGLAHYQEYGGRENRAHRFDEAYYLSRNADVARGVRRGEYRDGFAHWNQFGRYEGRPGGIGTLGQPNFAISK